MAWRRSSLDGSRHCQMANPNAMGLDPTVWWLASVNLEKTSPFRNRGSLLLLSAVHAV